MFAQPSIGVPASSKLTDPQSAVLVSTIDVTVAISVTRWLVTALAGDTNRAVVVGSDPAGIGAAAAGAGGNGSGQAGVAARPALTVERTATDTSRRAPPLRREQRWLSDSTLDRPHAGPVSPLIGPADMMCPGVPARPSVEGLGFCLDDGPSSGGDAMAGPDSTVWSCASAPREEIGACVGAVACVRAVRLGARQAPGLLGRSISGELGKPPAPRSDIRPARGLRVAAMGPARSRLTITSRTGEAQSAIRWRPTRPSNAATAMATSARDAARRAEQAGRSGRSSRAGR